MEGAAQSFLSVRATAAGRRNIVRNVMTRGLERTNGGDEEKIRGGNPLTENSQKIGHAKVNPDYFGLGFLFGASYG